MYYYETCTRIMLFRLRPTFILGFRVPLRDGHSQCSISTQSCGKWQIVFIFILIIRTAKRKTFYVRPSRSANFALPTLHPFYPERLSPTFMSSPLKALFTSSVDKHD